LVIAKVKQSGKNARTVAFSEIATTLLYEEENSALNFQAITDSIFGTTVGMFQT